ncbi:MAG: NifB/NifX family molybdenum-iron cluster-binding protein [Alistipes sp.]|nr:NifB/NifX family molybdenum-iron cluster-binding protein [Alistipes sp.]
MKIAIPTCEARVDDHFGHCAYYTIYETENGVILSSQTLDSPQGCGCKSNIAFQLQAMGVRVMLAGNMGEGAKNKLNSCNISVIRGCSGPVEEVVKAFLAGTLTDSGVGCASHGASDHVCPHHES